MKTYGTILMTEQPSDFALWLASSSNKAVTGAGSDRRVGSAGGVLVPLSETVS